MRAHQGRRCKDKADGLRRGEPSNEFLTDRRILAIVGQPGKPAKRRNALSGEKCCPIAPPSLAKRGGRALFTRGLVGTVQAGKGSSRLG
jgi:hypothetical protein